MTHSSRHRQSDHFFCNRLQIKTLWSRPPSSPSHKILRTTDTRLCYRWAEGMSTVDHTATRRHRQRPRFENTLGPMSATAPQRRIISHTCHVGHQWTFTRSRWFGMSLISWSWWICMRSSRAGLVLCIDEFKCTQGPFLRIHPLMSVIWTGRVNLERVDSCPISLFNQRVPFNFALNPINLLT